VQLRGAAHELTAHFLGLVLSAGSSFSVFEWPAWLLVTLTTVSSFFAVGLDFGSASSANAKRCVVGSCLAPLPRAALAISAGVGLLWGLLFVTGAAGAAGVTGLPAAAVLSGLPGSGCLLAAWLLAWASSTLVPAFVGGFGSGLAGALAAAAEA